MPQYVYFGLDQAIEHYNNVLIISGSETGVLHGFLHIGQLEGVRKGFSSGPTYSALLSGDVSPLGKPSEHQSDHCETYHTFTATGQILVVLTHSSISSNPCKCSFHHPTPRHHPSKFLGFRLDPFIGEPNRAEV